MRVIVVTSIVESDLEIVIVARMMGVTMASPVVTLTGAADHRDGNPYLVYGDAVAEFTGRKALDTNITVADCRSGNLDAWA